MPPPGEAAPICCDIALTIPEGELTTDTTAGPREIAEIVLPVKLWHEQEEVPLHQGRFHRYSDPSGDEVQRSEYRTKLRNLDVGLALQSEKGSRKTRFEITVKKNPERDD